MTATAVAPPFYRTSIGKKILMAVSGLVLLAYVIAHMLGNLKIYLGAKELDSYAEFLRRMGEPVIPHTWLLWILRVVVLAAFVTHIWLAIDLSVRSTRARKTRYAHPDRVQANPASTTMRWGGIAIALFVVFHLAQFTWGWVHPGYVFVRGAVYHNMVQGFSVWWITAIYLAAMVALGLHIYHGAWSMWQTFGANNERWDRTIRRLAGAVAIIVFVGNSSIPVMVLTGAVK
jgi:succinate dehydrogenase / fumarate reductase cytochrome b subunit